MDTQQLTPAQAAVLRVIDREGAATLGFKTNPRTFTVAQAPAKALVRLGLCYLYKTGRFQETYIARVRP